METETVRFVIALIVFWAAMMVSFTIIGLFLHRGMRRLEGQLSRFGKALDDFDKAVRPRVGPRR